MKQRTGVLGPLASKANYNKTSVIFVIFIFGNLMADIRTTFLQVFKSQYLTKPSPSPQPAATKSIGAAAARTRIRYMGGKERGRDALLVGYYEQK
jgi:hypothetical protein